MLGKLEIDLEKIQKLAKQREEENWKFRSFLKGSDYPSEKIDEIVHDLTQEISSRIDCTKCGNCCKAVKPVLTTKDIEELSEGMGMSTAQFRDAYLSEDKEEDGFVFKRLPCPLLKDTLCTQYSYRPAVCKSFPHLYSKDFVFRLMQAIENYSVCPIVFNVYESLKNELWVY